MAEPATNISTSLLGEVVAINPSAAPTTSSAGSEALLISPAEIDAAGELRPGIEGRRFEDARKAGRPALPGDLLYPRATSDIEGGRVVVLPDLGGKPVFCSEDFYVLRPKLPLTSRWLWHFLRLPGVTAEALRSASGAGATQRIRADYLRGLPVPLPSVSTQEAVSNLLDRVLRLRSAAADAERELRRLVAAVFVEMFGDAAAGNPKNLPYASLSDFIMVPEPGWDPKCHDRPALRGEYGLVTNDALTDLGFDEGENKALLPDVAPLPGKMLKEGDLLFCHSGFRSFIGRTVLLNQGYNNLQLPSSMWRLQPGPGTNAHYLQALLSSAYVRRQVLDFAEKKSPLWWRGRISEKVLMGLSVLKPPPAQQRDFAAFSFKVEKRRGPFRALGAEAARLYRSLTRLHYGVGDDDARPAATSAPDAAPTAGETAGSDPAPARTLPQADAFKGRLVWHKLSPGQQRVWDLTQQVKSPFRVSDLIGVLPGEEGKALNREQIADYLELLVTLGALIKEGRRDADRWRRPDPDDDREVEV